MVAYALALLLVVGACARPMAPPGGERDLAAPRLLSTTPAALEVVAAGTHAAIFRFDERISERGFSEALVSVSPLDSTLRVDRSGDEIRVQLDGGWRPNRVYRVVLLPGIRDLFGNERREPAELVFSTGAPVGNTALAGVIIDRVTGAPAALGEVDAVHVVQAARYTAIADSSGFYSLRYLPPGQYDVRAYDDQNRNRRRDRMEPVDSGYTAVFAQPTDTVALVFNVLMPDSTPPRITDARAVDSLHVRIEIDDYIEPASEFAGIGAEVTWQPDSSRYAGIVRVLSESAFMAQQRAAADTAMPPDTLGVQPPRPAAAGVEANPDLPVRVLVLVLDRLLVPGTYVVTIGGVTNLHGLQGGGTATFSVSEPAAVPEPAAPPPSAEPPPSPPGPSRRM